MQVRVWFRRPLKPNSPALYLCLAPGYCLAREPRQLWIGCSTVTCSPGLRPEPQSKYPPILAERKCRRFRKNPAQEMVFLLEE